MLDHVDDLEMKVYSQDKLARVREDFQRSQEAKQRVREVVSDGSRALLQFVRWGVRKSSGDVVSESAVAELVVSKD